jgi:hypothetical protein
MRFRFIVENEPFYPLALWESRPAAGVYLRWMVGEGREKSCKFRGYLIESFGLGIPILAIGMGETGAGEFLRLQAVPHLPRYG